MAEWITGCPPGPVNRSYYLPRRPRAAGGDRNFEILSPEMPEALIYYTGAEGSGGAAKQPSRDSVLVLSAKFPG